MFSLLRRWWRALGGKRDAAGAGVRRAERVLDQGLELQLKLEEAPSPLSSGAAQAFPPAKIPSPNLDASEHLEIVLVDWEENLLHVLEQKILRGQFELPLLPSTSMSVIDLAARPSCEIRELIRHIEADPTLSSELMRTANSALYASAVPCDTLNQAVLRMGLRSLRSMVFAISLRGLVLRAKSLAHVADEVWRQAYSMGVIARAIAKPLGLEPERAFLIGLLHDLGKLPLLGLLQQHVPAGRGVTQALVGRVFQRHHELAGAAAAAAWKLHPDLVAVAGHHHSYREHPSDARTAAFASLVHKLDLYLSLEYEHEYVSLHGAPELEFLGLDSDARHSVLRLAREAFDQAHERSAAA